MKEENLPNPWKHIELDEIAQDIQYGYTESANDEPVGPKFLRITDIQNGRVDWDSVPFCEIDEGEIAKYQLKTGDLLFARTGGTVGKSYLIQQDVPEEAVFASYLIRVKLNDAVDPRFAYYFFHTNNYWRQISESKAGIGQPNVNASKLSSLTLPLPPLPEQRSIVAKIEELFSNLDAGMDDLQATSRQLERYRLSVLQAAVEGRLTADWRRTHDPEPADRLLERILEKRRDLWEKQYRWERYDSKEKEPPSGWKDRYDEPKSPADEEELPDLPDRWLWTSLDAVTWNNIDYRGKTPPYSDSGIPTISAGNIKNGEVSFETRKKYVSEETYEEWLTRGEPEPGDLIITTEAPPGQTALLPEDQTYLLTRRVLACQTVHVDNRFLQLCFAIGPTERHVRGSSRGTTVDRILKKVLFKTPLPLPPIQEQKQIVEEVERLLSVADDAAATAEREGTRAKRLRQSILKQAFSGQLVPHNEDAAPPAIEASSSNGTGQGPSGDTGSSNEDSSSEDGVVAEELYNGGDTGKQIEMDL